ncbi:nuclear transport factor 2 family protein [Streptomyces sp. NPDC058464]|uniref:nuclear transport factor 2 family protein n=1 Tax=Streptomyces sp. NPDC058464 TaxID=3346511 RepID=UPI00364EE613
MTEGKRLSVEDRLDIQELFAKYAWALDTGDLEGYLACFTEDGYLVSVNGEKQRGREAIVKEITELWYGRGNAFKGRQHLVNHFLLTPEGEGVRARAFFFIPQFSVDYMTNILFGIGTWDNFCVKQDGEWRFKAVKPVPWLSEQHVPWGGLPNPGDPA